VAAALAAVVEVPRHPGVGRDLVREKVGDEGFRKAPVGAGPYKFVSFYGSYPDIDGLFREQAVEVDREKRDAILKRIQELMHEKAMFAPLWQATALHGVGPRIADSALGLIAEYVYSAPYEDVRLKAK